MDAGRRKLILDYSLACIAVAVAIGLRLLLDPILADRNPFITVFLALIFVTWYSGLGPAVLALSLGTLGVAYCILPPRYSMTLYPEGQINLVFFVVAGGAVILLFNSIRKQRQRAKEESELLRTTQEQFRRSVAQSPFPVIIHSEDDTILQVSEGWTRYSGYTLADIPTITDWTRRAYGEKQTILKDFIDKLFDLNATDHTGEYQIRAKNDELRTWDFYTTPLGQVGQGGQRLLLSTAIDVTEQKQAIMALRTSEEQRRLALDAAEQGAWHINPVPLELTSDERFRIIFHGSSQPITYEQAFDAIHPDDRQRVRDSVAAAMRPVDPAPYAEEYRVIHPNGQVHWVFAKGKANIETGDLGPRLVSFDGIVMDISQRKQMEAAAVEAQKQITSTLESITDAFVRLDRHWRIVYVNNEAERLTAYSRAELLGKDHWLRFPAVVGTIVETEYQRAVTQKTTVEFEYYFDQAERWFAIKADPTPDGGLAIFFRDITYRKKAEDEIARLAAASEQQRRLFETVLNNTPDLAYVIDLQHRFTYANQALLTTWGRNWEDSIGKHFHELGYEPWHAELHNKEIEQVARSKQPVRGEVHFTGTQGKRLYDYIFVPVMNKTGEVEAVAGTTRDVTEQKQKQEELRQSADHLRKLTAELSEANRRKDEFLATLAHELRNPLAPLRNGLQLLKQPPMQGTHEQALGMMDRQLTQMVHLVDDLLDVSRISQGKLELRRQPVELKTVLEHAVETSKPMIEASGHALTTTDWPEAIALNGDLTRLGQVFANLLNNAAKYSEPGGSIELSAVLEGSLAVVSVKDAGVGIPAAMLPKIFDMFTQVDRSLEKSQGGLGIGLTLVKRLVEMHGGSVEARSEGPGKGSEFVVRLPVQVAVLPAGASVEPAVETGKPSTPAAQYRMVVADDNVDSAESMAMLLTLLGHEVRIAHDGQQAFEVASEFQPQVILLDIGMPKLNGYETCRRIREQAWGQAVTIIAMTGWGQDEDRQRSREAGFTHHLVKPVDPAMLGKLLAGVGR